MSRTRRCLELFWTFFKIGLFTFGGGYAMISLIEDEVGQKRGWITPEELTEVFAIAESTPGPIAINSATYIGYRQAGVRGSASATLGVVLPSFIIIYVISLFIEQFMQLTVIANAFKGIQVAVAFLILRAGLRLAVKLPRRGFELGLCAAAGLLVLAINALGLRFSTVWLILCGGVLGVLFRRGAQGEGGASR